jgi:linoleoyl-CoA desaturase
MIIKYGLNSPKEFTSALYADKTEFLQKTSRYGNWKLYSKAILLGVMFISLYIVIAFHLVTGFWLHACRVLFAFTIAGIGFNIMHDGGHGSFSPLKWVNELMVSTLYLLGADPNMWKQKHNIDHHTHTNVHEYDHDIETAGVMRLHRDQKWRWYHRFQFAYWIILYAFEYVLWVFVFDIIKFYGKNKKTGEREYKFTLRQKILFWTSKVGYVGLAFVVPSFYYPIGDVIIGYIEYSFIVGIVISIVFQLAHTVREAQMVSRPLPSENNPAIGYIDPENKIHQLLTTANFGTKSKFFRKFFGFFTGGLNQQIEHHLWPDISHVHYPKLSEKVRRLCKQFNLPYNENSFFGAIWSHIVYLYKMGLKPS